MFGTASGFIGDSPPLRLERVPSVRVIINYYCPASIFWHVSQKNIKRVIQFQLVQFVFIDTKILRLR